MRPLIALALITLHGSVHVLAQTAPSFEVASVKPTPPADQNQLRFDYCQPNGRFTMLGTPVLWSLRYAYQVKEYQIAGAPAWIREFDAAYNIEATAGGPVSGDRCRLMVQLLFAERFKLKTHREQRESNVYFLTIAKNGANLRKGGEVRLNGGVQIDATGKRTTNAVAGLSRVSRCARNRQRANRPCSRPENPRRDSRLRRPRPAALMVLDTSALFAVLLNEADAEPFRRAIEAEPVRLLSAATLVETAIVIEARVREAGWREVELLIHKAAIDVVAVDAEQADLARHAYREFGKGRHAAALNYGDCFAYALSQSSGEPLLFKRDHFSKTDVAVFTL